MKRVKKLLFCLLSLMMSASICMRTDIHIQAEGRPESVNVYRLYNNWTGQHFYTVSAEEYLHLSSIGWQGEGAAWTALTAGDTPVYRLYNAWTGEHFYTADYFDYKQLGSQGWQQEGIVFYSETNDASPIYQLFSESSQSHIYTASVNEMNQLISSGWKNEGICWYGKAAQEENELPEADSLSQFKSSHKLSESDSMYQAYSLSVMRDEYHLYGELYLPSEEETSYPLVIICHGFNSSYANTSAYARDFARNGIAAYVFDYAGGSTYSLSDGSIYNMSVLSEEADNQAVLDSLKKLDFINAKEIFLMGESQGGLTAALSAADHPADIKGVLLYYPAFSLPDQARDWYGDEEHIPEHPVSYGNVEVGRKYFTDVINMDVWQETAGYSGPVLIVHGNEDDIVPVSYSEKASESYPNAQLHIIGGAGHGFTGEQLTEADQLSISFVESQLSK